MSENWAYVLIAVVVVAGWVGTALLTYLAGLRDGRAEARTPRERTHEHNGTAERLELVQRQ